MMLTFFIVALVAFSVIKIFEGVFDRRVKVLGAIGQMNAATGREIAKRCGLPQVKVNKELNQAREQGLVDRAFYKGQLRWSLTPSGRKFVWYATPAWKTVR